MCIFHFYSEKFLFLYNFYFLKVLDWLNQHGEPFLHRKTGIGVDPESASILTQNHQKFRAVAINTNKNAEQIFKLRHVLDDAGREFFK